jgi:Zn-dependent protease with chaperone function
MTTVHIPTGNPDQPPIPGPADRVSFFDEQRRRQRQSWRFMALSAIAAVVVGIPLSMFLTPVVYLATMGALRLVERWVPVPDMIGSMLRDLGQFVLDYVAALEPWYQSGDLRSGVVEAARMVTIPFGSVLLTVAALIIPGVVITVLLWLGLRVLFREAGVGGALLRLGAREPRADDLEERQLVSVVEEMAIAAGLPLPRIWLLDSRASNAAAIGTSAENAALVVTRGLLDDLDRDETQGVVAHLIGSIGNGDLRISLSITAAFQAINLVFTTLDAVSYFSRSAWRDLSRLARLSLSPHSDPRATEAVAQLLDHPLDQMRPDGLLGLLHDAGADRPRTRIGRLLRSLPILKLLVALPLLLLSPLLIPSLFIRAHLQLVSGLVVGPMLMRGWRARRYLADATAVQLTRNPDGLARALRRLNEEGAAVPGGQWFTHLFIVGSEPGRRLARISIPRAVSPKEVGGSGEFTWILPPDPASGHSSASREAAGNVDQMPGERSDGGEFTRLFPEILPPDGAARSGTAVAEAEQRPSGTRPNELAGLRSHPPIRKRLERLDAQGARLSFGSKVEKLRIALHRPRPRLRDRIRAGLYLALLLLVLAAGSPLALIIAAVLTLYVSLVLLLALASAVLFMALAMAAIYALLG